MPPEAQRQPQIKPTLLRITLHVIRLQQVFLQILPGTNELDTEHKKHATPKPASTNLAPTVTDSAPSGLSLTVAFIDSFSLLCLCI